MFFLFFLPQFLRTEAGLLSKNKAICGDPHIQRFYQTKAFKSSEVSVQALTATMVNVSQLCFDVKTLVTFFTSQYKFRVKTHPISCLYSSLML